MRESRMTTGNTEGRKGVGEQVVDEKWGAGGHGTGGQGQEDIEVRTGTWRIGR
jgi:hypothetical protein